MSELCKKQPTYPRRLLPSLLLRPRQAGIYPYDGTCNLLTHITATTPNSRKPFPFLALPAELCLHVLASTVLLQASIVDLQLPSTYRSLRQTCRSISYLTLSLLSQFTFHFTRVDTLLQLLSPRYQPVLQHVKHLRLDIRTASVREENARTGLDEFTALEEFPALAPGDRAIKTTRGTVTATHPHISRMSPFAFYVPPAVPMQADTRMYFEHDWPKMFDVLELLYYRMPRLESLRLDFLKFNLWKMFPTLVGWPAHTMDEVMNRVIFRGIHVKCVDVTGLGSSPEVEEMRDALTRSKSVRLREYQMKAKRNERPDGMSQRRDICHSGLFHLLNTTW